MLNLLLFLPVLALRIRPNRAFNISLKSAAAGHRSFHLRHRREIAAFDPEDFPPSFPYVDRDFVRLDSSDDSRFYAEPRMVQHVDDRAVQSLVEYYREEIQEAAAAKGGGAVDLLDVCASWTSHLPRPNVGEAGDEDGIMEIPELGRVAGIGMNAEELRSNDALTEFAVLNLNLEGNRISDAYEKSSFDVVTLSLSVDYLTNPLEVFGDIHSVLRPGGRCCVTFSDRCFPTKAVSLWLDADDIDRLTTVANYLHAGGQWTEIVAWDAKLPPLEPPIRPGMKEMIATPSLGLAWATANAAAAKTRGGDPLYSVRGLKGEA